MIVTMLIFLRMFIGLCKFSLNVTVIVGGSMIIPFIFVPYF